MNYAQISYEIGFKMAVSQVKFPHLPTRMRKRRSLTGWEMQTFSVTTQNGSMFGECWKALHIYTGS